MPRGTDDGPRKVANTLTNAVVRGSVLQAGSIDGGVHVHHHHHRTPRPISFPYRAGIVPLRATGFQTRGIADQPPLSSGAGTNQPRIPGSGGTSVVCGLGGVGKTQLAVDLAETAWAEGKVDLLMWITASSREAIVFSYGRMAVGLTGEDAGTPVQNAIRLLEWLAVTSARWLLVLDDLQNPGDLHELWPPITRTGATVVTTRRRDAALRGYHRELVHVGVFTPIEAVTYLRTALVDHPHLLDDVDGVATDLGFLPLALAQASAYMLDRGLSCAIYRTRLADRRRQLSSVVPSRDELPDGHRATVATTWSLSIGQANELEPRGLAVPLLEFASLLDPNGIPAELFEAPATLSWLGTISGREISKDDMTDGLACLHRMSLIAVDQTARFRAVRVHALVQRATRDSLTADRFAVAVRTVANSLLYMWPENEPDTTLEQVLRTNTNILHQFGGQFMWKPSGHNVLFRTGTSLGMIGQAASARDYFDGLHVGAIRYLGADHPDTLNVRRQAARWRGEAGDRKGALVALSELLKDQQRVAGPDHPVTLAIRYDLVHWSGPVGQSAEAKALLTDQLRVLGSDHLQVLNTRGFLAHHQGMAGSVREAITAYEALLADRLRILGPDHLDTLHTRRELARWHSEAGRHLAATSTLEHLLMDQTRTLGTDHPHTFDTRHELARCHGAAGDPAAAIGAFELLLADQLRVLGPDHPRTLATHRELAHWRDQAHRS